MPAQRLCCVTCATSNTNVNVNNNSIGVRFSKTENTPHASSTLNQIRVPPHQQQLEFHKEDEHDASLCTSPSFSPRRTAKGQD
ncbi:hypothetical protein GGI42DRAFT_330734 [Trichoderma sp. SZMC 28013]